ncbi:MAG TPA: MFS transporter, partial [Chloroflexota bacterium]|nr:MFS transporter [Chloroflexota bacterium]
VPAVTAFGVWTIFPVVVVLYAVTELFSNAATAAIPDVVPDEHLTGANAILNGISAAADFAYAVGGALIFVFGYELPFYFDAATFGFSALMIFGMRIPRQPIAPPLDVAGVLRRMAEGAAYLLRQPFLKWSTFALGVGALAGGITYVVTPLYASEALAKSPWLIGPLRGGPFRFSVLEVALGLGYLLASAVVTRLSRRWRRGHLFGAGLVGYGVSYALLAPCGNLFIAIFLLAFGGFCNGLFIITGLTLIQRLTPTEVRGRVFGANSTVINTSLVVGSAIGGGLLLVLPFASLWLLLGAVIVLSSLFVWLRPDVRSEA